MSEKYRFFTFTNFGKQYPIVTTDSGQLIVKIEPAEWEALGQDEQEAIVQADLLLAREWMGGATYIQRREPPAGEPGQSIWFV